MKWSNVVREGNLREALYVQTTHQLANIEQRDVNIREFVEVIRSSGSTRPGVEVRGGIGAPLKTGQW
jgi:hypothetical protein